MRLIVDCHGIPVRPVNQYLLDSCLVWSRNSIRTYTSSLVNLTRWMERQSYDMSRITQDQLAQYAHHLAARRNLKPTSSISALTTARAYCDWIAKNEPGLSGANQSTQKVSALLRSALTRLGILDAPINVPIKFVQKADAHKFTCAISSTEISGGNGKRNELIARLMFESGLRVSEVAHFQMESLPLNAYHPTNSLAAIVGKGLKRRFISITPDTLREILTYVDLEREQILEKYRSRKCPKEVFIGRHGEGLTAGYIQQVFRKVSARIGMRVVPHSLRHTYGTYHYLENRDLVRLQKLMGHSHARTTVGYVGIAVLSDQADSYHNFLRGLEPESLHE